MSTEIVRFGESTNAMAPLPMADFSRLTVARPGMANFAFGSDGGSDTLAALRATNLTSIAGYGLDQAFQGIALFLAAHNMIMQEMLSELCAITSEHQRAFGSVDSTSMTMEEMDQEGKPASQKIMAGVPVGFPLRRYGVGVSWNFTYFQQKSPADLAAQIQAMATADRRMIQKQIKVALFGDTNTPGARGTSNYDFIDRLGKGYHLPVKKILNADGAVIPGGPNGEVFDGTSHTHFGVSKFYWPTSFAVSSQGGVNASCTPTTVSADLQALTKNVREHWVEGELVVYISASNQNDVQTAIGFIGLAYQSTIPNVVTDVGRGALSANNVNNRQIGFFQGAEVWVKPWIPTDYILCFYKSGAEPPLVARIPEDFMPGTSAGGDLTSPAPGDLRIVQDSADHPLYAMAIERQIGFGAWNRWNAAVLFVGNCAANSLGSYTPPAL